MDADGTSIESEVAKRTRRAIAGEAQMVGMEMLDIKDNCVGGNSGLLANLIIMENLWSAPADNELQSNW